MAILNFCSLLSATLNGVRVPAAPVEAMIVLSIPFLGVDLARRNFNPAGELALTERYPRLVGLC